MPPFQNNLLNEDLGEISRHGADDSEFEEKKH